MSLMVVKIIVNLAFINYEFEKKQKKFVFFENIYKDLPKNIIFLIFIESINKCINDEEEKDEEEIEEEEQEREIKDDKKYEEMIEYIFGKIVNEVNDNDDINNIIRLINCIKGKDKENNKNNNNEKNEKKRDNILNNFLQKLIDKNLFKQEEFFALKNIINTLFKFIEEKKNLIIAIFCGK